MYIEMASDGGGERVGIIWKEEDLLSICDSEMKALLADKNQIE